MSAPHDIVTDWTERVDEITQVFQLTFTASEGSTEGQIVSGLARDVLERSLGTTIRFFGLVDHESRLIACVLFSRLTVSERDRVVFLLSPMAVLPMHQRRGLGRSLIQEALARLRDSGVTDVVTYGDIGYYSQTGFQQIDATVLAPPHPLSQPEGWLGQSLTGGTMPPISGRTECVAAFDNPDVW